MANEKGPFLSYAAVCEKVLRETDDVLSLIRIVDRVTVTVSATGAVGDEPALVVPPLISLTFALCLKSGEARGSVQVKVRVETPSGFKWPDVETTMLLEGEDRGSVLIMPMQFPAQDEGVYWFVVEINGELTTRVPLRIIKQVITQTIPPQLG